MAHYLVSARPKEDRLEELAGLLRRDAFASLRPFGRALTTSLRGARRKADGVAVWEEEDYCTPPLAEERAAVLDAYFDALHAEPVARGEGWARISTYPPLFPDLQ